MADRRSLNILCSLLCLLISTENLRVDATDNPLRYGTCGIGEEGEDGFCDSGDENMYLENVDNSDLKGTGASLQNKEEVESFSDDSTADKASSEDGKSLFDSTDENVYDKNVVISELKDTEASLQSNEDVKIASEGFLAEKPSNEDGNSLSEASDKQIHHINNSTKEWLGLQIPVVDGVEVSASFLLTFF